MNFNFSISIDGIYENSFKDQETGQEVTFYTAHLDNGYSVTISKAAVEEIKKDPEAKLCLINNKGKVKIDVYKIFSTASGTSIL